MEHLCEIEHQSNVLSHVDLVPCVFPAHVITWCALPVNLFTFSLSLLGCLVAQVCKLSRVHAWLSSVFDHFFYLLTADFCLLSVCIVWKSFPFDLSLFSGLKNLFCGLDTVAIIFFFTWVHLSLNYYSTGHSNCRANVLDQGMHTFWEFCNCQPGVE